MIRIIPRSELTATQIGALRKIYSLGIGDVRAAAASQSSIRDIVVFGSNWEEERLFLVDLWRWHSEGNAPFELFELAKSGRCEPLSSSQLAARLKHYRAIELEQMLSDLECGYIESHADFQPHDEDWCGAEP